MSTHYRVFTVCILISLALLGTFSATSSQAQSDNHIAFASDRDGNLEIYTMDPDGSNVQRLTNNPAQDIDPAWSPDRQQIAFVSNRDGNFGIYLMDANGRNVRWVTPDDGNYYAAPAWSPDGRYLALVSDQTGNLEIHTIDTNGNNLRTLTTHPEEDGEPHWSPDGSRIVFSSYRSGFSEIYTIGTNGGQPQQLTSGSGADNLAPVWSPNGQEIAFVANAGLYSEIYIMDATGANERVLITIDEHFIDSPTWSADGRFIAYQVSKPGENATIRSIRTDGQEAKQITTADYNSKWPAWFTAKGDRVVEIGEPFSCPGAPPPHLIPGTQARVTPGLPNRLRQRPSLSGRQIGTIPGNGTVDVLDGPECADGYVWWKVRYQGQEGWTAEGQNGEYWLEPVSGSSRSSNPSSASTTNADIGTCNGRTSRFHIGDTTVVSRIGDGLRILTQPTGGTRNALALASTGDTLEIQGGPICAGLGRYNQDTWYWHIYSYTDHLTGWVAKGPTTEQWVCPVNEPQCSPR